MKFWERNEEYLMIQLQFSAKEGARQDSIVIPACGVHIAFALTVASPTLSPHLHVCGLVAWRCRCMCL